LLRVFLGRLGLHVVELLQVLSDLVVSLRRVAGGLLELRLPLPEATGDLPLSSTLSSEGELLLLLQLGLLREEHAKRTCLGATSLILSCTGSASELE